MEPICLILQLFKKNNIYISYRVDDCINKIMFYISIDKSKKLILYFKDETFSCQLGKIDLDLKKITAIPGIKNNIVLILSAKLSKNIKDNTFPEKINIVSH